MDRPPVEPTDVDVLCGTGLVVSKHPGNKQFREIVEKHFDEYAHGSRKKAKMNASKIILDEILEAGTRFLKKRSDGNTWYVADIKVGKDKISHCLRDLKRERNLQEQTNPPQPPPPPWGLAAGITHQMQQETYVLVPTSSLSSYQHPAGTHPLTGANLIANQQLYFGLGPGQQMPVMSSQPQHMIPGMFAVNVTGSSPEYIQHYYTSQHSQMAPQQCQMVIASNDTSLNQWVGQQQQLTTNSQEGQYNAVAHAYGLPIPLNSMQAPTTDQTFSNGETSADKVISSSEPVAGSSEERTSSSSANDKVSGSNSSDDGNQNSSGEQTSSSAIHASVEKDSSACSSDEAAEKQSNSSDDGHQQSSTGEQSTSSGQIASNEKYSSSNSSGDVGCRKKRTLFAFDSKLSNSDSSQGRASRRMGSSSSGSHYGHTRKRSFMSSDDGSLKVDSDDSRVFVMPAGLDMEMMSGSQNLESSSSDSKNSEQDKAHNEGGSDTGQSR